MVVLRDKYIVYILLYISFCYIFYKEEFVRHVRMNFMKFIEEYYGFYKDLCETGSQTIYTKDLNHDSISQHFKNIINILKDGIETSEVQHMKHTVFANHN